MKWQRQQPKKSLKVEYTVPKISKCKVMQDKVLAEKGLTYDAIFTVPMIQFGEDVVSAINAKVAKAIDWSKLEKVLTDNGVPAEIAKGMMDAAKVSININAGLVEAVRKYVGKKHGLPADFWTVPGTGKAQSAEPTASDVVDVTL